MRTIDQQGVITEMKDKKGGLRLSWVKNIHIQEVADVHSN